MFSKLFFLITAAVLGVSLAIYFTKKPILPASSIVKSSPTPTTSSVSSPNPTTQPFYELTIPYLRSREYKSNLSSLNQVSVNNSYISYLTSYTSDGLKINGLLTMPKGQMPEGGWPAIVFVHGYIPPPQYRTLEKYGDYVDYLARNGFAVFKTDLRGHGNSEGQSGGGYYSSDYIIDTLNARAALQASDFINSQKIGLWGHSMAGNVVLRAFAAQLDIPAVVIWGGAGFTYLDLNTYGISDASYQPAPSDTERMRKRQQMRELYGDPKDGNPFWKLVSPVDYLKDHQGAIQLDHAVNDETVSVEYSRNLDKILDETTVQHELHEYSSGGHNISGGAFVQAMQNTVNFYEKHL